VTDTPFTVPDLVEPVVGWRTWLVRWTSDGFRLHSVVFPTVWTPGVALSAACLGRPQRALFRPWRRLPLHEGAADRSCECGVYAARHIELAGRYLGDAIAPLRTWNRAIGLVGLWGRVLECEAGWRASLAYPLRIYLPVVDTNRRFVSGFAHDLRTYGVPVVPMELHDRDDLLGRLTALHEPDLRRAA
jgi:hypothetical protein